MNTPPAPADRIAKQGDAVARAMKLDRSPGRVARRLLATIAIQMVGYEGASRWPYRLVCRLRDYMSANPPAFQLFPAVRSSGADGRHILLVSHDLSASGAPRLLVEIGQILVSAGMRVTVLSPSDGPTRTALVEAGMTVVVGRGAKRADAAIYALLAEEIDVAICNTFDAAAAVDALASTVPTIWYMHEVAALEERLSGPALPAQIRSVARIWCGSEMTAALLRAVRSDVRILPYGLAPITGGMEPGRGGVLRAAVLGSYEPRKGQDLLIAALKLLSPQTRAQLDVTFHGRVLYPDYHAALVAETSSMPGAHLEDALDRAGYVAAMLDCDAVIVPSRDDSLPLVSLDALGAGRVLMCTATTGTSAFMTTAVNGFIAERADPTAIAAMLEQAVALRAEWPSIARCGEQVFARTFSVAAFAAAILSEIDTLAPLAPEVA